jgi:hypothetical protein
MKNVIERLRREPILSRVGLAAILNVLIVGGVIDPSESAAVETALLAVVNAVALFAGRKAVTPNGRVVIGVSELEAIFGPKASK